MLTIKYGRKIIYFFSVALALGIYFFVRTTIGSSYLQEVRLIQYYAFCALIYLYLALLASPLTQAFPYFPARAQYLHLRRSLGLSAFFFALLHAAFAFFKLLGGFEGLFFLSNRYLFAISLSFTALVILTAMASTSFDWAVRKLGKKWKLLHRLVYLAASLIVYHALLLGSHFANLSEAIPQITFWLLICLLILELLRLEKFLTKKIIILPKYLVLIVGLGLISLGSYYYLFTSSTEKANLGIHSQHIQLAKRLQAGQGDPKALQKYRVEFAPNKTSLGQTTNLKFQIFNRETNQPVTVFALAYSKLAHLIITDSSLTYFDHVHPSLSSNTFTINYTFPKDATYHLYLDFQPLGERFEINSSFNLAVGRGTSIPSSQTVDKIARKVFGGYQVTLNTFGQLIGSRLTIGQQKIAFTVRDAQTNKAVTNLSPYLGAFGHLVMINQQTYEYLHIHPTNLTVPPVDALGGPTIEFLPIGIYGPIKAGTYRAFAQFNHQGKLFVADFTIKVE